MPLPFRRLVTGHDRAGRSVFILRDQEPTTRETRAGGTRMTDLWETTTTPAVNTGTVDAGQRAYRLPPPPNGSVFRIVEFPPDAVRIPAMRGLTEQEEGYRRDYAHERHPGFHKTATLDYAIVLRGEVVAMLDEGEEVMRAGDVLIQRGTSHAWSNRTNESAYVAFVLIDAVPVSDPAE